jgi:glucosamine--fructose-6-phosphate aminotransferase (isomerizing)
MAIWFAQIHNWNEPQRQKTIQDLYNLSNDIQSTLVQVKSSVESVVKQLSGTDNLFILGKDSDAYVAYEGSLKIKEISYIHSEGYSASSLKHGPFALLNPQFPTIVLNTDAKHDTKILNCVAEIKSRDAPVIMIGTRNADICVAHNASYSSLLALVPLQLIAYYLSVNRGYNPDKPKNLAKVVTVE